VNLHTRVTPAEAVVLTEAAFMQQVCELAEIRGWVWVHFRPAKTEHGWRTPVSGPLGKGWPDLMLARTRDRRIIFAELKRDGQTASVEQDVVLAVLEAAGAMAYIWRPRDWAVIEATLR